MRAVDTSLLVRLAARDDPGQVARAEAFVARGAWVPHLVLAEAVWILSSVYDRGSKEIATAIDILLSHEHLTLQDSDAVAAAVTTFRSRPALSFTDCLVLEVARKAGHLPVGTFDRNFSKLPDVERL